MNVIYIAGPYRASTEYEVRQNIRRAEDRAVECWNLGFVPLCPHKNSAGLGGAVSSVTGLSDDKMFLDGGIELLKRCDALLLVDLPVEVIRASEGTMLEINTATARGISVCWDLSELQSWENSR